MPRLTRLLALTRLTWLPWRERREQQTEQGELLLETGQAFLLESSPDNAGNPEYLLTE
jgi:hypothetical protein